ATLLRQECPLIVMITGGRLPASSASITSGGTSKPRIGSGGSTLLLNFIVVPPLLRVRVRLAAVRGSAALRQSGQARVPAGRRHVPRRCGRDGAGVRRGWRAGSGSGRVPAGRRGRARPRRLPLRRARLPG